MTEIFTLQDIYIAYRRFKNYYYYDNCNLFIRNQIAEFEKSLEFKNSAEASKDKISKLLSPICNLLNEAWELGNGDLSVLRELLNDELKQICSYPVPKEPHLEPKNDGYHFITNLHQYDAIKIDKCNFMIDAPLFIHLVSILWIEYVGVKLVPRISNDNYAYKLNASTDELDHRVTIKDGLMLFHPYFIGYQEWRDNALTEARRLLESDKDVTMLCLDIKRYYYSVRLNVPKLVGSYLVDETEQDDKVHFLNSLLQIIHDRYQECVENYLDRKSTLKNIANQETVLPVGLLSSGLLANIYLSKFDKYVVQNVAPSYYGRYVDDMIFVFQNRQVSQMSENSNPIDKFLKECFCSVGALREVKSDEKECEYAVNDMGEKLLENSPFSNLRIQSKKVILEFFDHKGSHAAIDIFMRNLTKNRSEYRFLPDEESITEEFDNEAYLLQYDDSINKLRSIKDFKKDKYGAAKYLTKQIYLSKLSDAKNSDGNRKLRGKIAHQLLTFFTGTTTIAMYPLWEKVATYFILNDDFKSLVKFYYSQRQYIGKIELSDNDDKELLGSLRVILEEHLMLSMAMPMALIPQKVYEYVKDKITEADMLLTKSMNLRKSNMLRNNYVGLSGMNLTNSLLDDKVSLVSDNVSDFSNFNLNSGICWMSPKYIHFEEINMLKIYRAMKNAKDEDRISITNTAYKKVEENYYQFSRGWLGLFSSRVKDNDAPTQLLEINKEFITIHDDKTRNVSYSADKKIALVNKRVDSSLFMNVVKYQKPLHTLSRKQELVKIINDSVEQSCDMLVMPELTVPFGWLNFLVERAKRSDMAIVTGLEYCLSVEGDAKRIINFVATILPIKEKYLNSCFVHLREKNFYSPKEELLLDGYHYKYLKNVGTPSYNLFHWRKLYFSVYNCFELADIQSRAKYMSMVDLIIAVEYNKDVHYFSDAVGAWARDIHCFIVQVNSSDFGDSKVIMPSKTEEKTLVQVKGGDNTVVLVCQLPINALRDFQLAGYVVQQNDKRFKFTPPSFDHNMAFKRHNDENLY